ncbi:MAG: DNA polymerase III subunit delta' [Candidatus Abyssobacteria bacterium SURF_5]|jgi:DNA polymerase-3 subunit delta'|uniref:DNA polymerase III subunit delta n=1 Tax=Abyssobacteria bacterium (strain SURF_5) TaxID=2093360 RepID=A0A3A4NSH3_ABYX5|nr:MAG: DNA polymerase III subunit delta' [Candidatus Abyssubacteria bacterium SURF_5]
MNFSSIADQPTAVKTLRSALSKQRVAHAYLFLGPSGVGRKLTARVFAAALNCEGALDERPCGACPSCRLIGEGRHPDVQIILPTKRSATITVNQIEGLLPFAYMRPIKGRTKVFIFSEADRLGLASANKMLKTFEEPPPSTVFILITDRPENMLPTVASRCQPVKFGRLTAETIKKILVRDFHVEAGRASVAAELAEGQVTRALQFTDPERLEAITGIISSLGGCSERLQAYDRLLALFNDERLKLQEQAEKDIAPSPEEAGASAKSALADLRKAFVDRHYREFLNDCLGLLLTLYRDILILRETGIDKFIFNRNKVKLLRGLAERMSSAVLLQNVESIDQASAYCSHYVAEDRVFLDLLFGLRHA